MKFVYCPRCKELRVKPWYTTRSRCARCRDEGREIVTPRTALTFVLYAMVMAVFALVYMYTSSDNSIFLIGGIVGLVIAFVVQAIEISKGERYARSKIKTTKADAAALKAKGRQL
ncbi:TPA: hypothetical protein HA259_04220 [Thermoplasmata archaeon]|nr:hypothetical protein [Thermoplasmata archaeon]